ncbi:hypothetical protein Emag_003177 [Eimeria magna]
MANRRVLLLSGAAAQNTLPPVPLEKKREESKRSRYTSNNKQNMVSPLKLHASPGACYILLLFLFLTSPLVLCHASDDAIESSTDAPGGPPRQPGKNGKETTGPSRIATGGIPSSIFIQPSSGDLPPELLPSALPTLPPTLLPSSGGPFRSLNGKGGYMGGAGLVVSELLEANAFARVGASFGNILVLTDVDDTLWSSGSMAAFGKHIGGIDSELARGLPYPAVGTLLFLFALGPHTSTPSGLRIPTEQCPVMLLSPRSHNCPIEVQGPPLIPRSPGILSARVSTSVLSSFTRPPSFAKDIESILTRGARHVYGSFVSRWALGFQNEVKMMHALGSQHVRGAAKIEGFTEALSDGARAVVVGDTGEKDPEATAGMAVKYPNGLAAVFLHSVFLDRQKEVEAATDPVLNELPKHAVPLILNAGGAQIPAYQLVYQVTARVREGERKVESFLDLSDHAAYAAGVQIAADVRQIFAVATRKQLLSLAGKTQGDPTPIQPAVPPLVFVHLVHLQTQTVDGPLENSVASQLASMSSKLAMKVTRWSAKRFSPNPELVEREGFRQMVELQPVSLQTPLQGVSHRGVRFPLGTPFASYRTVVGAGLASWALGMLTAQDMVSLVIAAVRDLRSIGPSFHCWQQPVVQDLLADVVSVEHYLGALGERVDLHGSAVYADAVASLRAFESFHREHCGRPEGAVTPLNACLRQLESALAAQGGRALQQLLPVLSLSCRYRTELVHWTSAGSEEVEGFAFMLGRAVLRGMAAASPKAPSLPGSPRDPAEQAPQGGIGDEKQQQQQHHQQLLLHQQLQHHLHHQQQQHQLQQQQQQSEASSETAMRKLRRDLALLPELAAELHVAPDEPLTTLSASLQLNALDLQTVESLRPFIADDYLPAAVAKSDMQGAGVWQYTGEVAGGRVNGRAGFRGGDIEGGNGNATEGCSYCSGPPIENWLASLHAFCANSRLSIAVEVCGLLRKWLLEVEGLPGEDGKATRGALHALRKVAEWNTKRPTAPLYISELGIVLEPANQRPGERHHQSSGMSCVSDQG